jgi:hypothetical protein
MKPTRVDFSAHPPERRRRPAVTLYGGCCCCCCCLHTIGSVIGAAVAPTIGRGRRPSLYSYDDYRYEDDFPAPVTRRTGTGIQTGDRPIPERSLPHEEEDEDYPRVTQPLRNRVSAVALFWWIVLGLSIVGLLWFASSSNDNMAVGLVILALVMPAVQLGSAFIVAIVLLCMRRTDSGYQFIQLGKITLGVILGTAAGIVAMVALFYACTRF